MTSMCCLSDPPRRGRRSAGVLVRAGRPAGRGVRLPPGYPAAGEGTAHGRRRGGRSVLRAIVERTAKNPPAVDGRVDLMKVFQRDAWRFKAPTGAAARSP